MPRCAHKHRPVRIHAGQSVSRCAPVDPGLTSFGGLFKQIGRQDHVPLRLRLLCHALESAQPNRTMADGDSRRTLEEGLAGLFEQEAKPLRELSPCPLGRIIGLDA